MTFSIPLTLISLQDDGFHLLVEIVLFGTKSYAVLDTGASRSVFDMTLIKTHIPGIADIEETQATTLFATAATLQATIPKFRIGRLTIENYETVALNLRSVNEAYMQMGHPPVTAIIGSDILLEYKASIHYKKLRLYLYRD